MRRAAFVLGSNGPAQLGRLKQLAFAESDAERTAAALVAPELGFAVALHAERSRGAVIDRFDEFASTLGPEDELLFYFAGHGLVSHGDLYLVLDRTLPGRLAGTALPWVNVKQIVRECGAGRKVVILDCCHAGEAVDDPLGAAFRGGYDQGAIDSAVKGSTASILVACGPDGFARESATVAGGVMTALMLRGLGPDRGAAADATGRVSLESLRDWMWRQIDAAPELAPLKGDRPRLHASGGPTFYLTRAPGQAPAAPRILWKQWVGRQLWKNTPVVVGEEVVVGSAGSRWNQPDPEDGVYCLDAGTGARRWFTPAPADVARVMRVENLVVAGCDDGTVMAMLATSGRVVWTRRLDGGVVGGPMLGPGSGAGFAGLGPSMRDRLDAALHMVLVLSFAGTISLLDLETGAEIAGFGLGAETVAGPLVLPDPDDRWATRHWIFVPLRDGRLARVDYDHDRRSFALGTLTEIDYASPYTESGRDIAELGADPMAVGDVVIQGIARDATGFSEPPLVAIAARTGAILWHASPTEGLDAGDGNLRVPPVLHDGALIFANAYRDGIAAVDPADGRLLWTLPLGRGLFEQWSAPVLAGDALYLGRHDGYLHKVAPGARRRLWSLRLGRSDAAGELVPGDASAPDAAGDYLWGSLDDAPIVATPALHRGRLLVGTYEGFLYCIEDPTPAA